MKSGGTLIMLLHNIGSYETFKILSVFDKIAEIQLFKPVSAHQKNSGFYLVAQSVQPGLPEAVAAVNEWKKVWKDLTFPVLDPHGQQDPPKHADEAERMEAVHELLGNFTERVIDLAKPIWKMQTEALENCRWTKNKKEKRAGEIKRVNSGEASTTATEDATLDAHDSKEDGDDTEAPHDEENALADSADVSVAMQNLDIGECDR